MQGIDVVSRYNAFLAKQTISKAIQASKSWSRTLITIHIRTGIVETAASFQCEAGVQVFAPIFLPGEQWQVL
jgi:hypothetical protein